MVDETYSFNVWGRYLDIIVYEPIYRLPVVERRHGIGGGGLHRQGQNNQDPLPFNDCAGFVNYLVGLATDAAKGIGLSQKALNAATSALGAKMMNTAYFEYERHIHNRTDGFKGELVDPGEQRGGVYGHIFFAAGATLIGGPIGTTAALLNRGKDWLQGKMGTDGGQYPAESAGNRAGARVGSHMWKFIAGGMSADNLRSKLRGELCN